MKLLRKEKNKKNINKSKLVIVCSLIFMIGGLSLIGYKIIPKYHDDKNNNELIKEYFEENKNDDINEEKNDELNDDKNDGENDDINEGYIGVLEIDKINLKRGFYSIDSKLNNVNKNIEVMKESNMPDVVNGNLIIAGHSGNAKVSYFRKLDKLELGDIAKVYYGDKTYTYKLVNIYEIEKNGIATIIRDTSKTVLTLITCKHNTNKQIIFIFELED